MSKDGNFKKEINSKSSNDKVDNEVNYNERPAEGGL